MISPRPWDGEAVRMEVRCDCGITHEVVHRPHSTTTIETCRNGTIFALGPDAWRAVADWKDFNVFVAHAPGRRGRVIPAAVFQPRPEGGSS